MNKETIQEAEIIKQPVVVVTIAGGNFFNSAVTMLKTLRKFHDWPVILYTDITDEVKLKQLPTNVSVQDLVRYLEDPMFYYRATPILAEPLLDSYELVLKLDADQLILGDLSFILETKDYDIGTVINWNRVDPQMYGPVELGRIGIYPAEYFNCGLVAMRNKQFVHTWMVDCFSEQFNRMQYKEQDILNILCYFANYNVRCFDHGDGVKKYAAWHGLIGKGEWPQAVVKDKKIMVLKGLGDTPFPPADMEIKVAHLGGGSGSKKDNWGAYFSPESMERINELIK
ncbi:MAG: glycosyltransferase family protein [Nitrosotalea sp.]